MGTFHTAASQNPQERSKEYHLFLQVDFWNLSACELVYVFVVFATTHVVRSVADNDEIVSLFSEGF